MMKQKIDTSYISPLDVFLAEFDREHPQPSASQAKEIEKSARVSNLRDKADAAAVPEQNIWEDHENR